MPHVLGRGTAVNNGSEQRIVNELMEEIRVICDSEITILNLKTGYIYKDEAEAQADTTVDPKDIRRDVNNIWVCHV